VRKEGPLASSFLIRLRLTLSRQKTQIARDSCSGYSRKTSRRQRVTGWAIIGWLSFFGLGRLSPFQSVDAATNALTPVVGQAVRADVSPPVRSIQPLKTQLNRTENAPVREVPLGRRFQPRAAAVEPESGERAESVDPAVQSILPAAKTPSPTVTFEGISNADNIAINSFSVVPPDTVGDVGPDHYVQAVNNLFKVFDKSGTSLSGPLPISALFAGFGGPCETTDDGDAIVLYDHLADRWLISQFANVFVGPPFHQCIAISQTGDPTGAYFRYDFQMPNNKINDYSKFGVWPDAYYMTDNQFDSLVGPFSGVGVFAFERDKMLVGDSSASFVYFDLDALDPLIFGMLPSDLDGPAPPAGTPNYFAYFTANEFGDPQDGLRIFEFHADFSTPANSTFTERGDSPIVTAPFDPNLCNLSPNCVPQRGTSQKVDAISERLMFRLQYRNFDTHESLVTNHTVDAGNDHAGIRYYELRRNLPGGSFVVNEQATFAPDSNHRWMGSAAMDSNGNIAVGYSVSGSNTFPSIRYAARLATDPPGGLFQGEAVLQAGGGSQTGANRWGDYSMLAVDPVDECTFWYTQEYYATSSARGWRTKIGSFQLPGCIHDLAVTNIMAKKTVTVASAVTAGVRVQIQNRSDHAETIEAADLDDGVTTGLVRLGVTVVDDDGEGCLAPIVALDNTKNATTFSRGPKVLKPRQTLTVNYLVTYNCTAAQRRNTNDATPGDYNYVATVHHDVLDGKSDTHTADDACPHDALPNQTDPNPPPKGVKDRGCGTRKPDGTLGNPVQTDALGDL